MGRGAHRTRSYVLGQVAREYDQPARRHICIVWKRGKGGCANRGGVGQGLTEGVRKFHRTSTCLLTCLLTAVVDIERIEDREAHTRGSVT